MTTTGTITPMAILAPRLRPPVLGRGLGVAEAFVNAVCVGAAMLVAPDEVAVAATTLALDDVLDGGFPVMLK